MDIRIQDLTRTYGDQKAVDSISFEVKTGEVLGFLGPNGAGKTTTMKMICCLLAPDQGRIDVGGHSALDEPEEVKRRIGYLPENNPLYEDMPVLDLLHFTAKVQGVTSDSIEGRVKEMVRVCGLGPEKHKLVGELSKGYRQRVGMAQAMVHDPEVLILDEPTTGLDPNQIVEIRKLIKDLGKQKTVILSTHILPEVEATCDRILIINNGKIVADGSPNTLRTQAQGKHVLRVRLEGAEREAALQALGSINGVEMVDPVPGSTDLFEMQATDGKQAARDLFHLCSSKGWPILELTPMEARLEDIFRDLTLN